MQASTEASGSPASPIALAMRSDRYVLTFEAKIWEKMTTPIDHPRALVAATINTAAAMRWLGVQTETATGSSVDWMLMLAPSIEV